MKPELNPEIKSELKPEVTREIKQERRIELNKPLAQPNQRANDSPKNERIETSDKNSSKVNTGHPSTGNSITESPSTEKPNIVTPIGAKQNNQSQPSQIRQNKAQVGNAVSVKNNPDLPPIDAYYNDQGNQYDSMEYNADDYAVLCDVSPSTLLTEQIETTSVLTKEQKNGPFELNNGVYPEVVNTEIEAKAPTQVLAQATESISEDTPADNQQNILTADMDLYLQWHHWIKGIECKGFEREILMQSSLLSKKEEKNKLTLKFGLGDDHKELLDDRIINRLKQKLDEYFKTDVKIDFTLLSKQQQKQFPSPKSQEIKDAQQRLHAAQQSFQEDPAVNLILNSFAAKIIHESVKPL